jgi:hypothetical protein
VRTWRNPLGEPEYALYTDSEELSRELSSKYYRARRPGAPPTPPHEEDREAYDLAMRIVRGDENALRALDGVIDDLERRMNELLGERPEPPKRHDHGLDP